MKVRLAVGPLWPEVENVFAVGYRGLMAGRIWLAADRKGSGEPWEWSLCLPLALPDDSQGTARTRDDALQAIANSLSRLIANTPQERLERAFLLATATALTFDGGNAIELSTDGTTGAVPADAAPAVPTNDRGPVASAVQQTVAHVDGVELTPTSKRKRGQVIRVKVVQPAAKQWTKLLSRPPEGPLRKL